MLIDKPDWPPMDEVSRVSTVELATSYDTAQAITVALYNLGIREDTERIYTPGRDGNARYWDDACDPPTHGIAGLPINFADDLIRTLDSMGWGVVMKPTTRFREPPAEDRGLRRGLS